MRNHSVVIAALTLLAATAHAAPAQHLDGGLITAMDRIGGNLLGTDAYDAVLNSPPDAIEPERLRIYVSELQATPVEIVVFATPPDPTGDTDPPDPARAFFRITVGGPERLKLEFDSSSGEIIPCILPPADLSGIGAPPPDSSSSPGRLRPGLVTALGEVGANLLGFGAFDAVLDPADPIAPQRLRLFVSKHARIEFVLTAPPEPIQPLAHIVVGPEVVLQFDQVAGGTRVVPAIEEADLSAVVPPSR